MHNNETMVNNLLSYKLHKAVLYIVAMVFMKQDLNIDIHDTCGLCLLVKYSLSNGSCDSGMTVYGLWIRFSALCSEWSPRESTATQTR